MNQLNEIIDTIRSSSDKFGAAVKGSETRAVEEIINLLSGLKTRNGFIVPNSENIKFIAKIKSKLTKLLISKDYIKAVKIALSSLDDIQQSQSLYFKDFIDKVPDASKLKVLKTLTTETATNALLDAGVSANVVDPIRTMLLKNVTTGSDYFDMVKELRSYMEGNADVPGALTKYAHTYVNTALNVYSSSNMALMTDGINAKWYRYVGSLKETSREFCVYLSEKDYVHISELPEILKGHIDGHKCAINHKTKLPYGLIEGTNEGNFMTNRGGWGCGHIFAPVLEETVPKELRDKFN